MNKIFRKIPLIVITIITVFFILLPYHQAHAGLINEVFLAISGGLTELLSNLSNLILTIVAWLLGLVGVVLNIAIVLTMNIKAIVDATPAINEIWIIIRNISSIFIIFFLLYASINMIIGTKGPSVKDLIGKIIIAGLLINFSLFFTKVGIDASNLISLQIYKAIVPQSTSLLNSKTFVPTDIIKSAYQEGGLSNVFQSSLKIPSVYANSKGLISGINDRNRILMMTVLGIVLMVLAGISFLAASVAFIVRLVVLILLMGFSPLYFAGMIFPQIKKDLSDKWWNYYTSQLLFMPVYLLFMYVAMKFISGGESASGTGGFFAMFDKARQGLQNETVGAMTLSNVGLLVQYTIAIILINVPLMAALQTGKGITGAVAGWGQTANKWVGSTIRGFAGRNTVGRVGKSLGSKFDNMAANYTAKNPNSALVSVLRTTGVSQAVRGQLTSMEKGKYGGKSNLDDIKNEDKARAKAVSEIQRTNKLNDIIGQISSSNTPPSAEQRKVLGRMTNSEIQKLGYKKLSNVSLLASLSSKQFESIMDNEGEGAITQEQKVELAEKRKTELQRILAGASADVAENYIGVLSGKEISKLHSPNNPIFNNNNVIDQLTTTQLQEMRDLDAGVRDQIGRYVLRNAQRHKAGGYIRNNRREWII